MHRKIAAAGACAVVFSLAGHPFSPRAASGQTGGDRPPGLSRLLAAYPGAALARGVATFDAAPTPAQVAALQGLGLAVQPTPSTR